MHSKLQMILREISLDIHCCIWSELWPEKQFSCCIPPKNLVHSSYVLCRYFQGKKRSMNILKLLKIATSTFLKSSVLWGKIETEDFVPIPKPVTIWKYPYCPPFFGSLPRVGILRIWKLCTRKFIYLALFSLSGLLSLH